MAETIEQFKPTLDHPWTVPTIRLIHEEILGWPPITPDEITECFEAYLFPDHCIYYGLAHRSELLGVGSLQKLNTQEMVINDLAVRHDMRGRGYGQRILTKLETVAKATGAAVMKVTPTHDSKAARDAESFYAYYGYRPTTKSHWAKQLI
jgi:GNAT superfamily N-acetyltransferase